MNKNNIKFYYNGIKVNGGKLIKCWYSKGNLINHSKTTIVIYASEYRDKLPADLNPTNDTETMTDYFEKDRSLISIDHPLYNDINTAYSKQQDRYIKQQAVRDAKYKTRYGS